ncbi:terpene synthase family protein [Streptomyces yaizuensis]|uniref:Terpene synthase family protein n=1 Tax=Streptomyces yaizuensis TaxID=2989713 RepID=A0ABQ5P8M6_9ACTN|nr:hypothetical protein [Streptomyces sp. YSPA8]GLF98940.1 terpene synthase family protein [Streptomyces sp. YSPA8]
MNEPYRRAGGPAPTTRQERHGAWLARYGLVPDADAELYRSYALPALIELAYPGAPEAELDLLTDILGWYTILDDHFDGPAGRDLRVARTLFRRFEDIVNGHGSGGRWFAMPPAPWANGISAAWTDLCLRQSQGRGLVWNRRSARDWRDCLYTFVAETVHRSRGSVPSVVEVLMLRRHGSAVFPFLDLLERVRDAEAPSDLRVHGQWHRLRMYTAEAIALINDLFSLAREERRKSVFNTVLVLQEEHGVTRERAVEIVAERVRLLRQECEVLRTALVAEFPQCREYLESTRTLVEAVETWTRTTGRYNGPNSQFPGVSVASLV